ncbi:MAG: L,D-transpeptidase [Patescibacteria group bacterium]
MYKSFLFTFLFALFLIAIVSYFHHSKRVYPHTYLGKKNISFLTQNDIKKLIHADYATPFYLKIKDRVYLLNYEHIGILFDTEATIRAVFEKNHQPFPGNIFAFFQSFASQQFYLPGFIFTQDFSQYSSQLRFNFTEKKDEIVVDDINKTLYLHDYENIYEIDSEHLKSLILFHFGEKNATVEPRLIPIIRTEKQDKIMKQNQELIKIYKDPIEIVLQDGSAMIKTSLSSEELKKIFKVIYENDTVIFKAEEKMLTYLLDAKIDPFVSRNKHIDMSSLRKNVISAFESRTQGMHTAPVVAHTKVVEMTQTHGEIAERYIEVNLGQQKMFLFDQGNMIKSYLISSGLHYPTPVGKFKIMNKAVEAYSNIYNVYMPYWMAFHFGWAGGQDAYFGIHELPYWYVGAERKQRPREFLGAPHTGGCISLDIGAAREVYDFSFVGMDVVIF